MLIAMKAEVIRKLLHTASTQIENSAEPENFDFEEFFSISGCDARTSVLLSDYLVCACGRGFAREIGMQLSDT